MEMMRRLLTIFLVTLALNSISLVAQFGTSSWPSFRGNLQQDGFVEGKLPDKLSVKWTFKLENRDGVESTAAIASNTVYFGTFDGYLYALELNSGKEKWKFKSEGGIVASPSIAKDGTIYFGSWDNHLYAVGGSLSEEVDRSKEDSGKDNRIIYFFVGAGILAILIVTGIIIIKKRKKAKGEG